MRSAGGSDAAGKVPLTTIATQWTRIGCIGFGGPPAHISLLRRLCVTERGWLSDADFSDGIAATNLLPGPASTQLAIFCGWRLRGGRGAVLGGACFILPGLVLILALAALFLGSPPTWVRGAAAGAGSAVAAVAVRAAAELIPASWRRTAGGPASRGPAGGPAGGDPAGPAADRRRGRLRWAGWLLLGGIGGTVAGPYLVLVLLGCGLLEVAARRLPRPARPAGAGGPPALAALPLLAAPAAGTGGLGALAWVALKVGLLSYGGGFVIVPLMRADAVARHSWMTDGEFLNAVALGQITPGPVVHTVAVVGYAAGGLGGGLLAALVAFAPSFGLVLALAPRFDRLRASPHLQAFLSGAGPAAIGAIGGSAVPLAGALGQPWQFAVLAVAAGWLLLLRRGPVPALLIAAALGVLAAAAGLPLAG